MTSAQIAVLDVGGVRRRRAGWAALDLDDQWRPAPAEHDPNAGTDLEAFADLLQQTISHGIPVALGFECPMFVPVPEDQHAINSPRCGEQRQRAFWAAAGPAAW